MNDDDILLDCLRGKLTSFVAICGYVSLLELALKEAIAHVANTGAPSDLIDRWESVISEPHSKECG